MADVTLTDVSKALGFEESKDRSTESYYGYIVRIDPDDPASPYIIERNGKFYYSVLIDGTDKPIECARLVNATLGDRVLVSVMQNGHSVVTNRIDGDLNANDAIELAGTANTKADNALTAAGNAQSAASAANEYASRAFTAASEAQTSAGNALSAANAAQTSAGNALSAANAAQSSADLASSAASAAQSSADTANGLLTGMQNAATAAGTTLNGIYADAETAKTNAQTALTNAGLAQDAADAASSAASAAQSSADTANGLLTGMQNAAIAAGTTLDGIYANAKESSDLLSGMQNAATAAGTTLNGIYADAENASDLLSGMQTAATAAGTTLTGIYADAENAKTSAKNASEYASRALGNLSTVQSVSETLGWITEHGTMTLTQDQQLDPTHVYFVQDNDGDYIVGGNSYSVVTEPDVSDISTYYVLSIDESLNNYVATHMAVTDEGVWIFPTDQTANDSYKILIATGGEDKDYPIAGTYIIDDEDNIVTTFGESITFNSSRPQYIGGPNAFIQYYDSNNDSVPDSIRIGGSNIILENGGTLDSLISSANSSAQKTSSMTYENGVLTIASGNGMSITIGNSGPDPLDTSPRVSFWDGDNEVAYVNNNQLYIPYTVVLNAMKVGKWQWRKQEDDNLTLQYIG